MAVTRAAVDGPEQPLDWIWRGQVEESTQDIGFSFRQWGGGGVLVQKREGRKKRLEGSLQSPACSPGVTRVA